MSLGSRLSPVSSSCNPGGGVESAAAPVRGRFWRQKQEAVRGVGWVEDQSRAFRGSSERDRTGLSTRLLHLLVAWLWAGLKPVSSSEKGHHPTSQGDSKIK